MNERPGPPAAPGGRPVVGHTLPFLRDPLGSLERWGSTDDDLVEVRVAGRRVVLVTDPGAVRSVLVTEADDYRKAEAVRDRLGTLQGGSLVLLEGEEWRERRRTLQSGFTRERVAETAGLTREYATGMVERWPSERPIRADRHARNVSLAVLARALFGLDLRGERTPIHDAADDVIARLDVTSLSTYLPEWVPTPTNRRYRRAVETLHERLDAIVERRAETDDGNGNASADDLLSIMLAAGLSPDRIRDELIAFLFAGFDSTATALSCTLGLLAENPGIQTDLRAELDSIPDDESFTPAGPGEIPLLNAVVRESLRLYPPQYALFREPAADVTLAGRRIDAARTVVLPPWVLHRDDRFWKDPTAFRPGRWIDDGTLVDHTDGRPEYAYFPYGGGPRHCLGMRLANLTLRTVVGVVCRRRVLESTEELSVTAGPTLSLDGGIELLVRRRESRTATGEG